MICPVCGAAELVRDRRDIDVSYKGGTVTVQKVEGDYCPACGEAVLTVEDGDRYSEVIGKLMDNVKAAELSTADGENPDLTARG